MRRTKRAALWGVVAAFVVVAVAAGVGYWYLKSAGTLGKVNRPATVVVVMAAPGEDGADVAQAVLVLNVAAGTWDFVDPMTRATVTGTSYSRVRDAYPFGGAAAVAAALATTRRLGTYGWVDVPYPAWQQIVDGQGLPMKLPAPMNIFDGTRLVSFEQGTQMVSANDIAPLLNGAGYLTPAQRADVLRQAWEGTLRRVAAWPGALPAGVQTDLSAAAVTRLRAGLPR